MSINLAFFTILALTAVYMILVEIFTIMFMMTGLSHTRSVFQVISLLTGAGFTTAESEVIVTSRKRRKIAMVVMVTGNFMNILVLTVLVNFFVSVYKDSNFNFWTAIISLLLFIAAVVFYKRVPFLRSYFERGIKKMANRWMYDKKSNPVLVLDNFHGYCIVEVKVIEVPELLQGKTIFESDLSNRYGIRVLFIKRGEENFGDIHDKRQIQEMDRVIVFGPLNHIYDVFAPGHKKNY
ncbi:MAG: TrkA C-terminal domain-containing protein [Vallitaleaceae bacterium]|nr:TrkA C-terminal domain-containing protein [Vallitaleaceae bacterium]